MQPVLMSVSAREPPSNRNGRPKKGKEVQRWVLTWPHWLRFRLAFDASLLTGALKVWVKTVEGWYRKRAREEWGIADGKCASIQGLQRFGAGQRA